jgi:pimeloyl-ACP methyl ester carboxylesterase
MTSNWWRRAGGAALMVLTVFGILTACQSRLIYFPRSYPPGHLEAWMRHTPGVVIEAETSQGVQRAFLQGNTTRPRNLWLVAGGNATLALEWSDWLAAHGPAEDAWLLVDFPGYGASEGSPNPARIREAFAQVVPAALDVLGWSEREASGRLRFFGHSLGAAACLIAASEHGIQRGVLLSPFTSTMEMARALTGLPLGFIVWHRFDNGARLDELAARGPGAVVVFHGSDDEVIPARMSRALAARQPEIVSLREIPGGRHNTLHYDHAAAIAAALRETGRAPGGG